jgi:hypothetical protein
MDTIMPVIHLAVNSRSRACLAFCVALLWACGKKTDRPPVETPKPETVIDTSATAGSGADDSAASESSLDSTAAVASQAVPDAPVASPAAEAALKFSSRPVLKAFPGRAWQYRPTLSRPLPFALRILRSPDSSMRIENGSLAWTPIKEGRFAVSVEASVATNAAESAKTASMDVAKKMRQDFTIVVEKVLSLSLKPLPTEAGKGDTIVFDLRGSEFPAWAADRITVRYDYQGDGHWDTEALPLAEHLQHRYAYDAIGRFTPKVEARYADLETQSVQGAIAVISPVMPVLKLSPDTVEPGGVVAVDASASKGDGALAFSLDLNGDGKPDWNDSTATKTSLKAPASGVYTATLSARNPMGQEGKATATLRVNARPRLELKVKNPKENMAAVVEFKVRAKDADDSLASVRFNFTGDAVAWETRATAPDSVVAAGEWWLRFKHAYGKPGSYPAAFCVTSRDGREACQQAKIEIFNAPPVCLPGADLKATLGKPLEIDGGGADPDGKIVKWEWDLDGDGKYDLVSAADGKFQYTFSKVGIFPLTLRVTSADGATAKGARKVEVRKKWKS